MHIESKETRLISLKLLSDRLFVLYKIDTCLTVSADLHICKGRSSFSPHISANVFARIWITTQYFFCYLDYIPYMQILVGLGLASISYHFAYNTISGRNRDFYRNAFCQFSFPFFCVCLQSPLSIVLLFLSFAPQMSRKTIFFWVVA